MREGVGECVMRKIELVKGKCEIKNEGLRVNGEKGLF